MHKCKLPIIGKKLSSKKLQMMITCYKCMKTYRYIDKEWVYLPPSYYNPPDSTIRLNVRPM